MAEERRELAPLDEGRTRSIALAVRQMSTWPDDELVGRWLTTLNTDKPEGRLALARAINWESQDAMEWVNKTIMVGDVTMQKGKKIAEDGQLSRFAVITLHQPDGVDVSFKTSNVLKSLVALEIACGPPPWRPPLPVQLKRVPIDDGKSCYALTLDAKAWSESLKKTGRA